MKTYNHEHANITTANGNNIDIYCHGYENPKTWGHKCQIYVNGSDYGQFKIVYYNRTWECFRYQSVIYKALDGVKQQIIASCENDLRHGGRLANGGKEKARQNAKATALYQDIEAICEKNEHGSHCVADLAR